MRSLQLLTDPQAGLDELLRKCHVLHTVLKLWRDVPQAILAVQTHAATKHKLKSKDALLT